MSLLLWRARPDYLQGIFHSSLLDASICVSFRYTTRPFASSLYSPVQIASLSLPMKKVPYKDETFFMAGPTGFEPAISSVTGRRVRPLHHEPMVGLKQIG